MTKKIKEMRNIICEYEQLVSKLKMIGIEIEEVDGYSAFDCEYHFIGAHMPPENKQRQKWLFIASDFDEFKKLANLYLTGREHGRILER